MTVWQALDANASYILGIGFVVSLMIWGKVRNRSELFDNDSDQVANCELPSPVVRRGSIGRTPEALVEKGRG